MKYQSIDELQRLIATDQTTGVRVTLQDHIAFQLAEETARNADANERIAVSLEKILSLAEADSKLR